MKGFPLQFSPSVLSFSSPLQFSPSVLSFSSPLQFSPSVLSFSSLLLDEIQHVRAFSSMVAIHGFMHKGFKAQNLAALSTASARSSNVSHPPHTTCRACADLLSQDSWAPIILKCTPRRVLKPFMDAHVYQWRGRDAVPVSPLPF